MVVTKVDLMADGLVEWLVVRKVVNWAAMMAGWRVVPMVHWLVECLVGHLVEKWVGTMVGNLAEMLVVKKAACWVDQMVA